MTSSRGVIYLGTLGTEQPMTANDGDLNVTIENLVKEIRTANGTLKRAKIAQKFHWQFSYKWIPAKTRDCFDGGMGRNDLYALMAADAEMSFLLPSDTLSGQLAYTARFAAGSWRERIIWRDVSGDTFAYSLNFELVQV